MVMRTFLEHVSPLTTAQFPNVLKTSRGADWLPKVLDAINSTRASGEIPNPVYVNIKDLANRLIEDTLKKPEWIYEKVFRNEAVRGGFTLWDLDGGIPYANTIAGKLKNANKAKATSEADRIFLDWFKPLLAELLPLAEGIVELKGKAVKRTVKTPEQKAAEKQAFIAPMAKFESGVIVRAALTQMSDDLKGGYAKSLAQYFYETAATFEALDVKAQKEQRRAYQAVLMISAAWAHTGWNEPAKLTPKAKAAFAKEADKQADDMQAAFVYKNSKKLVAILEKAGALNAEPKVMNLKADRGVFEGEMRISFASGASFVVRNKIVWKSNHYGTVFNQFPTTFHDVVMSDGKKMNAPSEERMNTVFA